MMIKVGKKELLAAVEKASVGCRETYVFTISDKKSSDGRYFTTVCASDGNKQAVITFLVEAEGPASFIVGSELLEVLKAVGEFGEEYSIKLTETVAEISSGSASMPLSLKKDGIRIKIQAPKKGVSCLHISVERDAFIKAVRQGSFAYGDATSNTNLALTVALHPETDETGSKLYFVSSDGRLAARSSVAVLQANEEYKSAGNMYISIEAPAIRTFCSRLESENIDLFIFNNQVTIRDTNDYYTIIRYETTFPAAVGELLNTISYNYKAIFDVSTLKAALRVATVLEEKKDKKAQIMISNEQVTISSVRSNNKVLVKAEGVEGEISITINAKHFDAALLDIGSDKVTVYGEGELRPLFIMAEGVIVLTAPFKKDSVDADNK